jgi:hypothetical protein
MEEKEGLIKQLLNCFVQYCGVSLGVRTFSWDFAWYILDSIPNNQLDLNDYFKKKMPIEFDKTKIYDVGCLNKEQLVQIGKQFHEYYEIPDNLKGVFDENLKMYILNLDE